MEKEEAKKLALDISVQVTGVWPTLIPDPKVFIDLVDTIYKCLIKE